MKRGKRTFGLARIRVTKLFLRTAFLFFSFSPVPDERDDFQVGSKPLLDFCTNAISPHASPPMKQRKAASRREIRQICSLASLKKI
ncbi:hypothetical protein ALC56_00466 [Trachymyrmex septentrionalis]|uniref:Secreted protein n=1 Tax=Trachymyrmex septentrionalis TaxID=34720 RepID=A0A195FXF2_9HYME|nr:hypothetical protein ALC56_00466 [Trachymyrmex septentrionalis]